MHSLQPSLKVQHFDNINLNLQNDIFYVTLQLQTTTLYHRLYRMSGQTHEDSMFFCRIYLHYASIVFLLFLAGL